MLELGVHPLHITIIMGVKLTLGLTTPPMGLVLFVASTLTRLKVLEIARELAPFLVVHIVTIFLIIFLITYLPALSMTLPKMLGLY
jgi:TRAP-type C4-dicarboxylate transport system permease large subunit